MVEKELWSHRGARALVGALIVVAVLTAWTYEQWSAIEQRKVHEDPTAYIVSYTAIIFFPFVYIAAAFGAKYFSYAFVVLPYFIYGWALAKPTKQIKCLAMLMCVPHTVVSLVAYGSLLYFKLAEDIFRLVDYIVTTGFVILMVWYTYALHRAKPPVSEHGRLG
jgi:hypothetical protein